MVILCSKSWMVTWIKVDWEHNEGRTWKYLSLVEVSELVEVCLETPGSALLTGDRGDSCNHRFTQVNKHELVTSTEYPDMRLSETSWPSTQALFKTCGNPVLCFALLLSEICLPTEFQVETFYSSYVLSRTKFEV